MYEGPKVFGEDNNDMVPEEPFDYFEHAKKLREEREEIRAKEKQERDTKEADKKAEKKARLAKKIADKATEKLEEKSDKLAEKSLSTKEELSEAKIEAVELGDAIIAASHLESPKDELPAPVEMAFTNGSEYTANLQDGEEAIFDLNHTIEKAEETVTLADGVQEQADALARARVALENIGTDHVRASFEGHEDNSVVFGETGPQEDVRDRLIHTWETPAIASTESTPDTSTDSGLDTSEPYSGAVASAQGSSRNSQIANEHVKNEPTSIERFGSGVKNGAAYVGGIFTGRAVSSKNRLEHSNAVLMSETRDLQREIQSLQLQPAATRETIVSTNSTEPISNQPSLNIDHREVRGTNEPAIPKWINQIENDVRKGKVPELKKWQIDVLRAQHPELLKKYEKLDQSTKEHIKKQSAESIKGLNTMFDRPAQASSTDELPAPAYALPSYMTSQNVDTPSTTLSAYEYATAPSSTNGSVFSSEYLTIVVVGGLLFGAALIAAFGF